MTYRSAVVIIPAYNAAATIGRAIASALAEPEVGLVFVVDDCSTDGTAEVVRACDDNSGRLRLRRLDANQGPSAARNLAIAESDLPYIALLDADDYLLPGRFARLLAAAGDDWDFLADNMVFVPIGTALSRAQFNELTGSATSIRPLELGEFVDRNVSRRLHSRAEWGFIKPLFRRAAVHALSLTYDPALRLGEDYVFYCQALIRGARFRLLSNCGYVAEVRAESLSGNHRTSDLEALARADAALIAEARFETISPRLVGRFNRHLAQLKLKIDLRRAIDMSRTQGRGSALAMLAPHPWRLALTIAAALRDRSRGPAPAPAALRKLFSNDIFA